MKHFIFYSALVVGLLLQACTSDNEVFDKQEIALEQSTIKICVADTSTSVPTQLAEKVALDFFNHQQGSSTRSAQSIASVELVSDSIGTPSFYVVNYQNNKGFVLVSATQRYMPVLAYSEKGNFDISQIDKTGVSCWVQTQKNIIKNIESVPDSCKRIYSRMWSEYNVKEKEVNFAKTRMDIDYDKLDKFMEVIHRNVVKWKEDGYEVYQMDQFMQTYDYRSFTDAEKQEIENTIALNGNTNYGNVYTYTFMLSKTDGQYYKKGPLLSSMWDQALGYNQYVPNNGYLGCVAVALGQIINYHQYPAYIRWEDMPDDFATETTAHFLKGVGDAVGIDYNNGDSGATITEALGGIKQFGYTNARIVNHSLVEVSAQIYANHPVYMRGTDRNSGVGHAWVCDGTDSYYGDTTWKLMVMEDCPEEFIPQVFGCQFTRHGDMVSNYSYHFNWGWNGAYDGFYTKESTNIYKIDKDFSKDRKDIVDIYPVN